MDCPFCTGAEAETPPAVWIGQLTEDDQQSSEESACRIYTGAEIENFKNDDWSVRVVPNRFPAIQPMSGCGHKTADPREGELFAARTISGGHEVIIESPQHVRSITQLDLAQFSLALMAYRDRVAHYYNCENTAAISVFKNVGGQAGASLMHSHAQLIATDVIPTSVNAVCNRLAAYRAKTGCCLQCDLIRGELKAESRVVAKSDSLVAYCPLPAACQ